MSDRTDEAPEDPLAFRVGGSTVGENLRRSLNSGYLTGQGDGTLRIAGSPLPDRHWVVVDYGPPLGCDFLMDFLFYGAYAQSAVPHGCRNCYKVKVVPRSLRELIAALDVAKGLPCRSKWGVDLDNRFSQNVYAGYFYTNGLDAARATYRAVRQIIDARPFLGPDIVMTIKRGCSEYEAVLGPSDRYQFAPEMAALEDHLRTLYRSRSARRDVSIPLADWIDVAFRIGDDTYLDYTGGERLRPRQVTYDP
ncbi:MAG: hypothetical protein WDN01_09495 [Rhizomicrobium sp.]